jgi:hypothetical protein
MVRWLISVPVWGERYVDEFCATALPPLDRAVAALREARPEVDVRLIIHTDRPERIAGLAGAPVECRPVPAGARDFDCMSQAHREVLGLGVRGDVAVILTAGTVMSAETLTYCADVLDHPRRLVVLCAVPRVLAEGQIPDTSDAPALMAWAWDHRHPITIESTWPDGRSADLSRTYYERGGEVASRVCLPHPLAIRIDGRPLRFTPTIDVNLINCFDRSEMHLVPNCDRLAVLKLTPPDKGYRTVEETMFQRLEAYRFVIPDPQQRWCLSHRIALVGRAKMCPDVEVVEKIMQVSGDGP